MSQPTATVQRTSLMARRGGLTRDFFTAQRMSGLMALTRVHRHETLVRIHCGSMRLHVQPMSLTEWLVDPKFCEEEVHELHGSDQGPGYMDTRLGCGSTHIHGTAHCEGSVHEPQMARRVDPGFRDGAVHEPHGADPGPCYMDMRLGFGCQQWP